MNRFRNFLITSGLGVFIVVASPLPSGALTINVTYDSSVTNIGTLAQVQTAFGAAAETIQNLYTNSSTVNVTVYSANAGPFGDIDLGESSFSYYTGFNYADVTNALSLARTTGADSNSVASLPASDPTGGGQTWGIPSSEAKALSISGVNPNDPSQDGSVGFATNVNYTFDPNNRTVAGKFDFIGVAEHELTEIMGRSTLIPNGNGYFPYDLFRFTNNGARSFDPNANNAYFSVDDGATALKYFYTNVNLADIQDWLSSTPPDAFDAFVPPGSELILSSGDLTAVDILGYNLNYKPPRLTGATLGNGTFQLNFTNTPGTAYTVLASTNFSLSVSNWTVLGTTTEGVAGQFQFTDLQATTNKLRFYRVRLN
jgi:hypothetical protein